MSVCLSLFACLFLCLIKQFGTLALTAGFFSLSSSWFPQSRTQSKKLIGEGVTLGNASRGQRNWTREGEEVNKRVPYWAGYCSEQLELNPLRLSGRIDRRHHIQNARRVGAVHQLLCHYQWHLLRNINLPVFVSSPMRGSRLSQLEMVHWPGGSSICSWYSQHLVCTM